MKKSILLLVVICSLSNCSKNEKDLMPPPTPDFENGTIPINICSNILTRATDAGFENNDKVGIYVVNYNGTTAGNLINSGNHVDNMGFTYFTEWTPDSKIYWKDKTTKADFYCYYPHNSSISNIAAYPFSIQKDQSSDANYKASDFLWGKISSVSPTAEPINIQVKHAMSNVLIYLQAGEGYTDETFKAALKGISICNTKINATINLSTGIVTATDNIAEVTPRKENDYYRALIVPQDVTNSDLIKVMVGNNIYTLKQTITFEANKQHKCTLSINRIGSGINIGIGGWETDDTDNGGTVE